MPTEECSKPRQKSSGQGTSRDSKMIVTRPGQFENDYLTEMCSDSEAGSYLRLKDFVYHSTVGLRVIDEKYELDATGPVN